LQNINSKNKRKVLENETLSVYFHTEDHLVYRGKMSGEIKKILKEYTEKHNMLDSEFADKCGLTRMTIYNINKKGRICAKTAYKIEAGTHGEIKAYEICDELRKKTE
jgi:DNA-binding XRE family transcriptional regulator